MNYFRRHYIMGGILIVFATVCVAARLYLGTWVLEYVNQIVNNIPGYAGSVTSIDIDLYRGAYRIHHLKLFKKSGNIPTPFVHIDTAELSIQWGALFHGRIVSNVDLEKPIINFAVNPSGEVMQTGAGIDWTKPIQALTPIDINLITFRQGELTYQDFSTMPKVNIYIHNMSGEVHNLRNVVDTSQSLPSTLSLTGDSIGNGKLKMEGRLNILKQIPDMDIKTQLENVQLHALSNYSNAYASVDIKGGTLNLYSEVIVKNNHVSGYIKPIATHISLIDLHKDANPVKVAWESLVSVVLKIFTNLPKDQFATKIQLAGTLDNVSTDTWSTIGGILHNAFISALKKGMDSKMKGNR